MKQKEKQKEKEKADKLKVLRRELEGQILDQLPQEMLDGKISVEVQKIDESAPLEEARARQVIEALLFASTKPLSVGEIRKVVKSLTPAQISKHIQAIKETFNREQRSFEVVEIAGGFEVATRKEFAPWIVKIELQKKAKQVTQSALETLAIMVYKQPITRAEVEEIRGVDVSGVLSTLMERQLIKIVGKKDVPGRPFLYGTTDKFLEHFGLGGLNDLPNIDEIRTLVESSVKKEDLIGTQNIVDVPESTEGDTPPAPEAAEASEPEDEVKTEESNESESDTKEN